MSAGESKGVVINEKGINMSEDLLEAEGGIDADMEVDDEVPVVAAGGDPGELMEVEDDGEVVIEAEGGANADVSDEEGGGEEFIAENVALGRDEIFEALRSLASEEYEDGELQGFIDGLELNRVAFMNIVNGIMIEEFRDFYIEVGAVIVAQVIVEALISFLFGNYGYYIVQDFNRRCGRRR